MKIDTMLPEELGEVGRAARDYERSGYSGLWTSETRHEPFLQCLTAANATTTATVGTSIAIAFARTPMTMAHVGYDLAEYSGGRFILGLGSQVKPHIERRFSMPWSRPAPRMREFILAMRAIWACWTDGVPLKFHGEFYTHSLMTPFFTPRPHAYGPPPVYLAGVGPAMTEVAGEVADGFFVHPFTTVRYLREVTLPALLRGRARRDLSGLPAGDHGAAAGAETPGDVKDANLDGFAVCGPSFITTGRTEEEMTRAVEGTKKQIAFYASTPAYLPVLELHGWADVQPETNQLSKQGRWDDMGTVITDEMLHEFSVVGTPEEVSKGLLDKIGSIYDRASLYTRYPVDDALLAPILDATR
jgi:probable F420-dependent oxidoreductase